MMLNMGKEMDYEDLQKLQDEFCKAHRIYCACLNRNRELLTEAYGIKEEQEFLWKHIRRDQYQGLLEQLSDHPVEDMLEEERFGGFLRLSAVTIRVNGEITVIWFAVGLIRGKKPEGLAVPECMKLVTDKEYESSVRFLYAMSQAYIDVCASRIHAVQEAEESRLARFQMETELRRSEVMTRVVQMLESEQDFIQVVREILQNVCGYLGISGGSLIRLNKERVTLDMICEWRAKGIPSVMGKEQGIPQKDYPFVTGNPYVISTDSPASEMFEDFFQRRNILAGIFLPVEVNGQIIMYLSFIESARKRIWEMQDIQFLNDVKKIIQSILAKRITKNSLTGSYVSLEAILENVGCGICVKDFQKGKILFKNECFDRYFGGSAGADGLKRLLLAPPLEGEENPCGEFYLEEADKWFDIHYTEILWVDGRRVSLFTVYDITDNKRYQQKIERQANNDFLTGLYNRMRCEEDLAHYIRQAKEMNGEGALLYIDLDDFKHINDGLGHRYGDVLLKAISHSLQRVPGIERTCYRMGGDEFIIIVTQPHYGNMDRILCNMEEIFTKPWFLKGADYYCTMSMGIVRFPTDGDTVQELIQKADIALYEAKKRGKNRYEFYSDNVEFTSFKRLDLEKNMRNATMNACDEFEVYYQPILDISKPSHPCTGAEALLRWNSSSLGFISPTEFIPLAEYLGLINPIGSHVLTQACRRCRYWNENGRPEFKVNVNLSVVQLLQNDIADKVKAVLEETGVRPGNLTLEVTESLAINDMARMKMILGKIKSLGVRVALDDFGTGYSSLSHLREMPIDVIKIDRCFIQDLGKDQFADVFVKVVSELAGTIGMNLCVEGVETREQYEILKSMQIQMIQGFYFDKPMRLDAFEKKYL